jgi:putative MATE family efflux protein
MDKKSLRIEILKLSIPASLEIVFQMLLGLIDMVFVSKLGEVSLAGVSITNQIVSLILLIFGTIGVGGSILIAQYYGKGEKDKVSLLTGQMFVYGIMIGLITTAALLFYYTDILEAMGATEQVIDKAGAFFKISALSMPVSLLGTLTAAVLRSMGNTKTPLFANAIAIATNTALNYLFIFGFGPIPKLGVTGAGYATLISRIISASILIFYMFFVNDKAKFQIKHFFSLNKSTYAQIFKLSYPVTIGEAAWATGAFLYTVLFTRLGTDQLVSNQIIFSIEEIFIMFSFGFTVSGLTIVGHEIGKKNFDIMNKKANEIIKMGVIVALIFGTSLGVLSRFVHFIYPDVNDTAMGLVKTGLLIYAIIQPIKVTNFILGNGILKGGGDIKFIMFVDCFVVLAIGIPSAYFLGYVLEYGFYGVVAGKILEEITRFILMTFRYKSKKWYRFLAQ